MPPLLSIVSPVYRAGEVIEEFCHRVMAELDTWNVPYEIVLVDDRSPDHTWQAIRSLCGADSRIHAYRLSKNFGQHYAVTAGLSKARGEWICILDCDLQDDPGYIRQLHEKASAEHLDIVFTKRDVRAQPVSKQFTAWLYTILFGFMADTRYGVAFGSLVLFNAKVKHSFLAMRDHDRLYLQVLRWLGYEQGFLEVKHHRRFSGRSAYTLRKMLHVAVQGWVSFSNRLLYYSIYFGFFLAFLAFVATLYIIYRYLDHGYAAGWPSLFVAIIFATGVILMSVGILGVYIGKTFEQAKQRPLFIVDEALNDDGLA
jgi:dolichol-phosphate mannosyltransferase